MTMNEILQAALPTIKYQWMFFMIFIIALNIGTNLASRSKFDEMIKTLKDVQKGNKI